MPPSGVPEIAAMTRTLGMLRDSLIERDRLERERQQAEMETRAARDTAEAALHDLKAAQANLIQAEKMASLGQLTAGNRSRNQESAQFRQQLRQPLRRSAGRTERGRRAGARVARRATASRGRRGERDADRQPPTDCRARQARRQYRQEHAGSFPQRQRQTWKASISTPWSTSRSISPITAPALRIRTSTSR